MLSSTDEMGPYKNGNGLSERRRSMKKADPDDLRSEYRCGDLGLGVRGKYLKSYRSGTNLVLLHPDIEKAFPTQVIEQL